MAMYPKKVNPKTESTRRRVDRADLVPKPIPEAIVCGVCGLQLESIAGELVDVQEQDGSIDTLCWHYANAKRTPCRHPHCEATRALETEVGALRDRVRLLEAALAFREGKPWRVIRKHVASILAELGRKVGA